MRYSIVPFVLMVVLASCGAVSPSAPMPATSEPTPSTRATQATQPSATPSPAPLHALGQQFTLAVGESATLATLQLKLVRIENDSRCPSQVTCVWAGAADAIVRLVIAGVDNGEITLNLSGANHETEQSQTRAGGYLVRFVALDPYPAQPGDIPQAHYQASFIVEPDQQAGAGSYTLITNPSYTGVIVPEADGPTVDPHAAGYWTPEQADISQLEAGLAAYLRQAAVARSADLWQRQSSYKRQYTGLVRDGKRLIHVSFLCDDMDGRWKEQVVVVLDGGDCFFQLTFNVDAKTYGDLMINGEA